MYGLTDDDADLDPIAKAWVSTFREPGTVAEARQEIARIAARFPLPGDVDPLPDNLRELAYRLDSVRARLWFERVDADFRPMLIQFFQPAPRTVDVDVLTAQWQLSDIPF